MASVHPDIEYKCRYCEKKFKTYNGRLKHMLVHKGYCFQCQECGKTFPYPSRLNEHVRRHTKKGLIPCLSKGCRKKFTTKRAMKKHMQLHDDKKHKCEYEQCIDLKPFDSTDYLRQHVRAVHLKNYDSRCGIRFPNPGKKDRHQKKCDACIAKKIKVKLRAK